MKILFPTDFSEAADHAFIYALQFADKINAEIATVHVYDLPEIRAGHLHNTMRKVYESITLEQFESYKDHIPHLREIAEKNNLRHIQVKHSMVAISTHGIVQTIVREGKKANADMIVMGTTGASGLKEVFLGSIAAEVLENATSPVLAIPVNAHFDGKIDKVAFATEYSMHDQGALKSTIHFAELLGARVYVVHVDTAHTELYAHPMDSFKDGFKERENISWEVVDHTGVEEGLVDFMIANHIDILAMHVKKRNFIEELFTTSLAKKMANRRTVPVLALH
jgi:nucleotide-binding universal stress UspA family protein